jgi:TPR repeat protein
VFFATAERRRKSAAYCLGGAYLLGRDLRTGQQTRKNPVLAFQNTLKAAEQGYVPAAAAVGMMYAVGKGTQQDYAEAARWWTRAAEAGHTLAATNLSMVYRGVPGVKSDSAKSEYWAQFVKTTVCLRSSCVKTLRPCPRNARKTSYGTPHPR